MKLSLREMRIRQAIEMATGEAYEKYQAQEIKDQIGRMIAAGIIAYHREATGINPERKAEVV